MLVHIAITMYGKNTIEFLDFYVARLSAYVVTKLLKRLIL